MTVKINTVFVNIISPSFVCFARLRPFFETDVICVSEGVLTVGVGLTCLFFCFVFLQHKMEREWILRVLEEGISDGHCYELCDQQGIFQTLLGFSSSPLCDEHSQVYTKGNAKMQHISSEVMTDERCVTKGIN